jgi:UDP-N-acetylmuramyl pentapeptide phosphotransferase/UDP-N-acetylglucosamine-1-phosphate transferase
MLVFFTSFFVSLVATLLVIRSSTRHAGISGDHDFSGPQKFHSRPVPRIGGLGVFVAVVAGAAMASVTKPSLGINLDLLFLILASLPAFAAGMAEDLTKRISPRRRLVFTAASALLAVWLLDAVIRRTDIPGLEVVMGMAPVAVLFTTFAVAGVANAVNIIDGFNGLAAMCVAIMTLSIAYVAFQVGDIFLATASLIVVGAVFGFFVWNFPAGLIFLGDGGAYFLGFMVAELNVLLLHRNPSVSPIFPHCCCAPTRSSRLSSRYIENDF